MKTTLQLAVVALAACGATWGFDASSNAAVRIALLLPILPGALMGLGLSGHGGNRAVATISATITNAIVWGVVWLGIRTFIRRVRTGLSN